MNTILILSISAVASVALIAYGFAHLMEQWEKTDEDWHEIEQ